MSTLILLPLIGLASGCATKKVLQFVRNGTAHVHVQSLPLPPPSKQATRAMGKKCLAANQFNHPTNSVHISSPDLLTAPATATSGKIFINSVHFHPKPMRFGWSNS